MVALSAASIKKTIINPLPALAGFLFYGSDELQIGGYAAELARSLKKAGAGDAVRLSESDAVQPDRLKTELTTPSLFGDRPIVWLSSCPAKVQTMLLTVVSNPFADAFLIVQAPDLRKSHKLTQLFESERHLAALPCYGEDQTGIVQSIRTSLRGLGHDIDDDAISLIANRADHSTALIKTELEKLSTYVGANTRIAAAHVLAVLSEQQTSEVFEVIDAALAGHAAQTAAAFARLMATDPNAAALVVMLTAAINRLHGLRVAVDSGASPAAAVKQLQPPVFFKQQDTLIKQLKLWPLSKLEAAWSRCNAVAKETRLRPALAEAITLNFLLDLAKTANEDA